MLLQQKVIERSLARRRAAVARYRELLARGDHPRSGDEDALVAVLGELGRKLEDLSADADVVRRMVAAEQTISEAPGAESSTTAGATQASLALTAAQAAQVQADAVAKAAAETYEAACGERNRVVQDVIRARGDLRDGELYFRAILERRSLDDVRKAARTEAARAVGGVTIHGPAAPNAG